MICLAHEAVIRCDAPGCINEQPGRLALKADGTLGVLPRSLSWQLLATRPGGPLLARCPEHIATEKPKPEAPTTTEATP